MVHFCKGIIRSSQHSCLRSCREKYGIAVSPLASVTASSRTSFTTHTLEGSQAMTNWLLYCDSAKVVYVVCASLPFIIIIIAQQLNMRKPITPVEFNTTDLIAAAILNCRWSRAGTILRIRLDWKPNFSKFRTSHNVKPTHPPKRKGKGGKKNTQENNCSVELGRRFLDQWWSASSCNLVVDKNTCSATFSSCSLQRGIHGMQQLAASILLASSCCWRSKTAAAPLGVYGSSSTTSAFSCYNPDLDDLSLVNKDYNKYKMQY